VINCSIRLLAILSCAVLPHVIPMRMSALQKSLLLTSLERGGRASKTILDISHQNKRPASGKRNAQNVVTKTLENLIDKGFLVGEGVRTPKKWYIKAVRLTAVGRRIAKELRGKQLTMRLR